MEREIFQYNFRSPFCLKIIDYDKILKEKLKKGCNHGVCGGRNLGNTCYMNGVIACLSNCTELTAYFLSGEYKQDVN